MRKNPSPSFALIAIAVVLSACSGNKSEDSAPATGTPGGTPTGTVVGTTGTPSGTPGGTPTGTTTQPPRVVITGCDPTFCTLTPEGGAYGGDLCSCTIDGPDHPQSSYVEASCFGGTNSPVGHDLTLHLDLDALGYAGYAVDTCLGYTGDFSLAVYEDDPLNLGAEVECVEDATDEASFCAKITDPGAAGVAPTPTAAPGTGQAWIVFDEWDTTAVWNGVTPRQVDIELFTELPVCGNGIVEVTEECDDGNTDPDDGCDPTCQRDPVCGDGYVDFPEECDDGNLANDDGCDDQCAIEPVIVDDCDPAWCTFSVSGGPNGGDLCTCTLPGTDHPQLDDVDLGCSGFSFVPQTEVLFRFDTTAYASISASTCDTPLGTGTYYPGYPGFYYQDSAIALFEGDPLAGGTELACDNDAANAGQGCSKLWDTEVAGEAAALVNTPTGTEAWFVVDDTTGGWWDGVTDRVITFELSPNPASVCGDGTAELTEACDDGNNVDGDGCSASCTLEPMVLNGCDPTFCVLDVGTGPNGGDLCTCTLPGTDHPQLDTSEASCFGGAPDGAELVLFFDVSAGNYLTYAVDTCSGNTAAYADSSVASFAGDPTLGGLELECSEDANGYYTWCSKITDSVYGTAPGPAPLPISGELWVMIDEWNPGDYWDGATDRVFSVELIP